MKRDGSNNDRRGTERVLVSSDRGRRSSPASKQAGFIGRATAQGRSGYGSESVRPFLRDQLKLKELMTGPQLAEDKTRRR